MKISWLKLDNDNKNFKIPTSFGMDVFSVNSTENVDNKIDELIRKLSLALKKVNVNQVIIAGGVSANQYLRKKVAKLLENTNIKLLVPSMLYGPDNGAMIGAAAYPLYLKKQFTTFDLNATPNAKLY